MCLESRHEWVGLDEIKEFMRGYMRGSVSVCSNALKSVRVFFGDFLGRGSW